MEKLVSADSTTNKSALITKVYMKAEDQLFADDRARLAVLMSVGGWLQGACISTAVASEGLKSEEVITGVWNQIYSYSNVKNMMLAFPNDPQIKGILATLESCEGPMGGVSRSNGKVTQQQASRISELIKKARKDIMGV